MNQIRLFTCLLLAALLPMVAFATDTAANTVIQVGATGETWINGLTNILEAVGPLRSAVIALVATTLVAFDRLRVSLKAKNWKGSYDVVNGYLRETSDKYGQVYTFAKNVVNQIEELKTAAPMVATPMVASIKSQSLAEETEGIAGELLQKVREDRAAEPSEPLPETE